MYFRSKLFTPDIAESESWRVSILLRVTKSIFGWKGFSRSITPYSRNVLQYSWSEMPCSGLLWIVNRDEPTWSYAAQSLFYFDMDVFVTGYMWNNTFLLRTILWFSEINYPPRYIVKSFDFTRYVIVRTVFNILKCSLRVWILHCLAEWLERLLSICKVSGLKLGKKTDYPDSVFPGFPQTRKMITLVP